MPSWALARAGRSDRVVGANDRFQERAATAVGRTWTEIELGKNVGLEHHGKHLRTRRRQTGNSFGSPVRRRAIADQAGGYRRVLVERVRVAVTFRVIVHTPTPFTI